MKYQQAGQEFYSVYCTCKHMMEAALAALSHKRALLLFRSFPSHHLFCLGIISVNPFLIKSTGSWKTSMHLIGTGCYSTFLSLWVASLFWDAKSLIQFFHTFMQYHVKHCQRNLYSSFLSQDF